MNGIDISSYQSDLDLHSISYDLAIIKATEGLGYVNPHCDIHFQQAKEMGKKRGVYHFANSVNDAAAEANYFVDNVLGYVGDAILVLDYERGNNDPTNVGWAYNWLKTVQDRTGVKPMIYLSESNVNAVDWSPVINGDFGLWVAKYWDNSPDYNYDMSSAGPEPNVNWGAAGYAMWQWTSTGRIDGYGGNLDCDEFYGDQSAWDAYARPIGQVTPPPVDPQPEPTPEPVPEPIPTPTPEPTPEPLPDPLPPIPEPIPVTPMPIKQSWVSKLLANFKMSPISAAQAKQIIKAIIYAFTSGFSASFALQASDIITALHNGKSALVHLGLSAIIGAVVGGINGVLFTVEKLFKKG